MKRILITGMSATGKSSVIDALRERGYRAVDLDTPQWSEYRVLEEGAEAEAHWSWKEDRVETLLSTEDVDVLFVAGCAPNQGMFYPYFDRVVLLTASEQVTRNRLATRTSNNFGKTEDELIKVLADKSEFEERLEAGSDVVIETDTRPLDSVVDQILKL